MPLDGIKSGVEGRSFSAEPNIFYKCQFYRKYIINFVTLATCGNIGL